MLPRVIIHNAVSLDSRIDSFEPDLGLYYELVAAWGEDATLVGTGTVLAAPEGAVRDAESEPFRPVEGDPRPLLVVPDSLGRVRCWRAMLDSAYWRAGVSLCSDSTPGEHLEYLRNQGIDTIVTGEGKVDMRRALEELSDRYGVEVVRVDSGGTLNGVLLGLGLVSEVSLLISPVLVGSATPRTFFTPPETIGGEPVGLKLVHLEELRGGAVWARYEPL